MMRKCAEHGVRCAALLSAAVFLSTLCAPAQSAAVLEPQATAEDALAALVHRSAVIFAGEVYAIRLPGDSGTKAGITSSRADAVEVEFRVDVGIRGTSIGNNYVLRMPLAAWQQSPAFTLHQHAVTFLEPADAAGLSSPVRSEADLPGMDVGVMTIDRSNAVDLTRLGRLVTKKTLTPATMPRPADPSIAAKPPVVANVTTQAGEETLVSGSSDGRMPELRNGTVPFLALVRDITVLSAAESPAAAAAAAR